MKRRIHLARRVVLVATVASVVVLSASCSGTDGAASPGSSEDSVVESIPSAAASSTSGVTVPALCAELPASSTPTSGRDLEGFFNPTPADAEGHVLTDPADWLDPRMIEHPRVALVDTDTGAVISTYDRVVCSVEAADVPEPDAGWPPGSTAIVDMDTHEVLDVVEDD